MNLALMALSLAAAALLQYGYEQASSINRVSLGRSLTPLPSDVAAGERVLNILLVGSDSSARLDANDPIQIGRQGERFGDVIIVAHIDERTQQVALLSFPRDLWVPLAGTNRSDRINRAFEVGGPAMLIDTIESNFDIPIHHYVNVDFAGFQGLVEAVGSVEIYFENPARDWNVNARPEPRSQTGFLMPEAGCQALDPPTALAYVRSRYYQTQLSDGSWVTDPSSDFGRIRRQQDFLRRLIHRAIELGARNPFVLNDLVDAGLDNVAIDGELTPQLLVDLGAAFRSFDPEELQTYSFPAADAVIDGNQVLRPIWGEADPVLALLRGGGFDNPSTISLTMAGQAGPDPARADLAKGLSQRLRSAGYAIGEAAADGAEPGVTIHHGPDGHAAATTIEFAVQRFLDEENVNETVRMVPVDHLGGRSVLVAVGPLDGSNGGEVGPYVATTVGKSPRPSSDPTGLEPEATDNGPNLETTAAGPGRGVGGDVADGKDSTSSRSSAARPSTLDSVGTGLQSSETACRS